jgi:hypothetical protein
MGVGDWVFSMIPLWRSVVGHGMSGGPVFFLLFFPMCFFSRFILSLLPVVYCYHHRRLARFSVGVLFDGMLSLLPCMLEAGRSFVCNTLYFNVLYCTGVGGLRRIQSQFTFT